MTRTLHYPLLFSQNPHRITFWRVRGRFSSPHQISWKLFGRSMRSSGAISQGDPSQLWRSRTGFDSRRLSTNTQNSRCPPNKLKKLLLLLNAQECLPCSFRPIKVPLLRRWQGRNIILNANLALLGKGPPTAALLKARGISGCCLGAEFMKFVKSLLSSKYKA